eukprot:SAG11_NODE_1247_length_5401_cov_2.372878_4_plen_175_part_00
MRLRPFAAAHWHLLRARRCHAHVCLCVVGFCGYTSVEKNSVWLLRRIYAYVAQPTLRLQTPKQGEGITWDEKGVERAAEHASTWDEYGVADMNSSCASPVSFLRRSFLGGGYAFGAKVWRGAAGDLMLELEQTAYRPWLRQELSVHAEQRGALLPWLSPAPPHPILTDRPPPLL